MGKPWKIRAERAPFVMLLGALFASLLLPAAAWATPPKVVNCSAFLKNIKDKFEQRMPLLPQEPCGAWGRPAEYPNFNNFHGACQFSSEAPEDQYDAPAGATGEITKKAHCITSYKRMMCARDKYYKAMGDACAKQASLEGSCDRQNGSQACAKKADDEAINAENQAAAALQASLDDVAKDQQKAEALAAIYTKDKLALHQTADEVNAKPLMPNMENDPVLKNRAAWAVKNGDVGEYYGKVDALRLEQENLADISKQFRSLATSEITSRTSASGILASAAAQADQRAGQMGNVNPVTAPPASASGLSGGNQTSGDGANSGGSGSGSSLGDATNAMSAATKAAGAAGAAAGGGGQGSGAAGGGGATSSSPGNSGSNAASSPNGGGGSSGPAKSGAAGSGSGGPSGDSGSATAKANGSGTGATGDGTGTGSAADAGGGVTGSLRRALTASLAQGGGSASGAANRVPASAKDGATGVGGEGVKLGESPGKAAEGAAPCEGPACEHGGATSSPAYGESGQLGVSRPLIGNGQSVEDLLGLSGKGSAPVADLDALTDDEKRALGLTGDPAKDAAALAADPDLAERVHAMKIAHGPAGAAGELAGAPAILGAESENLFLRVHGELVRSQKKGLISKKPKGV